MANKYSAFAAKLQISIASVFTDIAGVRNMTGPGVSMSAIKVSSRDNGWDEFVAGMKDAGELTFDIVYDPDTATHSASVAGGLLTMFAAGTSGTWKLSLADTTATTYSFSAFVTKFTPKLPFDGMQSADITLKLTSSITFA